MCNPDTTASFSQSSLFCCQLPGAFFLLPALHSFAALSLSGYTGETLVEGRSRAFHRNRGCVGPRKLHHQGTNLQGKYEMIIKLILLMEEILHNLG